jgi:hypothetical protein
MGWSGGAASRFLLGLAAVLATAFVLGSQAFLNYWFFVGAVAIVAVAIDDHLSADAPVSDGEDADRPPTPRDSPSVLG